MTHRLNSGDTFVDVVLGGQPRTLRFNNSQRMTLASFLKTSPLEFLRGGGDIMHFLVMAVFSGLSVATNKDRTVSPQTVSEWLDGARKDASFDPEELAIRILYAIANGEAGRLRIRSLATVDDLASVWSAAEEVGNLVPPGSPPEGTPGT